MENRKRKPKYLYHYTSFETSIVHILKKDSIDGFQLKMNSISNMNDLNESLIQNLNLEHHIKFDNQILTNLNFLNNLVKKTKLLCFSITDKLQGYSHNKMWSEYANKYKGICLELDYEKFVNENKDKIEKYNIMDDIVNYGTAIYNNTMRQSWEEFIKKEQNIKQRFFNKSKDWENETEYRFLKIENNPTDDFLSIDKSLTKVILGPLFYEKYVPLVSNAIELDKMYHCYMKYNGELDIRPLNN